MTREQYLISLMKYYGIPYIWGGKNPLIGLDCSGLVYNAHSLALNCGPQFVLNSQGYFDFYSAAGIRVLDSGADLGDLCFYGKDPKSIHHVGICLNQTLMIEAAHGGRDIINETAAKLKGAKVEINPISRLNDLIAIYRPIDLKLLRAD